MGSYGKILNSGHADSDANANTNTDSDANANANTNSDSDSDANADTYSNANAWNRCCLVGRYDTCGSDVGWRRWGWLELGWG